MNREHLYRGKRKDNGEWIYGSLISLTQDDFIVSIDHYNTVDIGLREKLLCNALWEHNDFDKVKSETAGEYTGLIDKNGNKIFEGDICFDDVATVQIVWIDDHFQWGCKVLKKSSGANTVGLVFPLWQWNNCEMNGNRQLEILGNIHNNPELLTDKT